MTTTDRNRLREEEELAIGPLLARAKLFRMRQQWEEAIAACTDALRKFPISVTACSLLGEIYEAQGRLNDAAQWYGMALERDPQSVSDRAGLERIAAIQQTRQAQEPVVLKPSLPPAMPKPVTEKTLEWFDRVFPPGDSRSIARMLYAVSAVIGVVLLIGVVIIVSFSSSRAKRPLPELAPPELPDLGTPPTPVVVEPSARVTPLPRTSTTEASPTPAASPTVAASATPNPPRSMNTDENRLITAINRLISGVFLVQSAYKNETGDRARIEILVPVGETVDRTRELVLRSSALTAKLAGQLDTDIQAVSVHAYIPGSGNAISAFNGDIATAALMNIEPGRLAYNDLLSRFARLEWEGPLAPRGEVGPLLGPGLSGSSAGAGGNSRSNPGSETEP